MTRFEETDYKDQGSEAPDTQNQAQRSLTEEYLSHVSDAQQPRNSGSPEQTDERGDQKETDESEDGPERLASGDTLQLHEGNEFLIMPDGSRMAILNDIETQFDLPVPLNERLVLQDNEGKGVSIKYAGTLTSIPPRDEYRFSNGIVASVESGITQMKFPNGDVIVLDELGLVAIKRRQGTAVIRKPEATQPTLEDMVVPKPAPRTI